MEFVMPSMLMPNPQNVILIGGEAGKRDRLEAVHDVALLLWCDGFTRCKRQNARLVLVLKAQAVDKLLGSLWITAQHRGGWVAGDRRFFRLDDRGFHTVTDGAGASSLATRGEPDNHLLVTRGCLAIVSTACWIACRCATTSIVSAAPR